MWPFDRGDRMGRVTVCVDICFIFIKTNRWRYTNVIIFKKKYEKIYTIHLILSRLTMIVKPGFQVRGGALKKIAPSGGGGAKIVGVFRVKNYDFTPKNHIFSNFRGGVCPPWIRSCNVDGKLLQMALCNRSIDIKFIIGLNVVFLLNEQYNRYINDETQDYKWK